MKVYVATSGSYSSYDVEHVFLKEEDARAWCDADIGNHHERSWNEYDVLEAQPVYKTFYSLTWWPYLDDHEEGPGAAPNPRVISYEKVFLKDSRPAHRWDEYKCGPYDYTGLRIEGWDRETVMKVYSDQRGMYTARKEGIA